MYELFRALSSEQRLRILTLINELTANKVSSSCCAADEVCVCQITQQLNLAPSTISHHLNILKAAGLLRARRESTWIYYSIDKAKFAEAAQLLKEFGNGQIHGALWSDAALDKDIDAEIGERSKQFAQSSRRF